MLNCLIEEHGSREEWLLARMKGIGASDTAGILGEGYEDQSAVTVWDSKRNAPREVDPRRQKRFNVAKRLEPAMRDILSDELGFPCRSAGEFTIYRNPDFPWLFATLDGLIEHPDYGLCVAELKDVGAHNRKDWECDEPPLKFSIQNQHQLAATGLQHCFTMGLIGREPVVKHVERNERFIDAMLAKLEEFWGYVERGELPPIDSSLATGRILAKLWPEDSGMTVLLPPESVEWDRDLQKARADRKDAEARETAAENLIKAAIKDASYGECGDIRYSWKTQSRKEVLQKACTFRVLRRGK